MRHSSLPPCCPTCRGPLEDDDELVLVNERVQHLDDVGVGQLLEQHHLLKAAVALLLGHLKDLQSWKGSWACSAVTCTGPITNGSADGLASHPHSDSAV